MCFAHATCVALERKPLMVNHLKHGDVAQPPLWGPNVHTVPPFGNHGQVGSGVEPTAPNDRYLAFILARGSLQTLDCSPVHARNEHFWLRSDVAKLLLFHLVVLPMTS